ncbi:MAG: M3 family peptidase [Gammaproteobacteria bacterium]|nr:MAG: M3 family peptidase [Gammaproteobacteria bacterium]
MKLINTIVFSILIICQACNSTNDQELINDNPLLIESRTLHQTLPFEEIESKHLLPAFQVTFKDLLKKFQRISKLKEEPSFENTILPIEIEIDRITSIILYTYNLNSALNDDEIQEATQKMETKLGIGVARVVFNKKLIRRVKSVYDHRENLPKQSQKAATEKIYFMFQDFVDLGFFKKLKFAWLEIKSSTLASKFSRNLLDEARSFELHIKDSSELVGIPQMAIEAAAETAEEKGKEGWIFTLHRPSYSPVIRYAQNREIREKIYRAYAVRGNQNNDFDNKKLIKKTVSLRMKRAQLMGYETYAHFALRERMASTPATVNQFLQELTNAVKPFAERDIQEIRAYIVDQGIEGEPQAWDYSYYITKLKEERYGYKEEETRPYFALSSVKQGVFHLSTILYGVTFRKNSEIQVYHEDVEAYEVFDEDKSFLGVLYLDFFPREGKSAGAWNTIVKSQKVRNGINIRPHTVIVTNFNGPTENMPALLTFGEMNTFMHEFGHALHQLFSQVDYAIIGSGAVYWDFIELPSQIMENWAVEKVWLNQWATHFETGEKIPDVLVDKIIESRNYMSGYDEFNGILLDRLDMAWHSLTKLPEIGVKEFETAAISDYKLLPDLDEACISTRFSHIFSGGYAAGYYSYHWANVLDADAYTLFTENGIFDKATATAFRKNILEKGALEHPMVLYKSFKGSEPTIDAMLARRGLH